MAEGKTTAPQAEPLVARFSAQEPDWEDRVQAFIQQANRSRIEAGAEGFIQALSREGDVVTVTLLPMEWSEPTPPKPGPN